jgi:hypothetical protein
MHHPCVELLLFKLFALRNDVNILVRHESTGSTRDIDTHTCSGPELSMECLLAHRMNKTSKKADELKPPVDGYHRTTSIQGPQNADRLVQRLRAT